MVAELAALVEEAVEVRAEVEVEVEAQVEVEAAVEVRAEAEVLAVRAEADLVVAQKAHVTTSLSPSALRTSSTGSISVSTAARWDRPSSGFLPARGRRVNWISM